jgi:hypothetical protein
MEQAICIDSKAVLSVLAVGNVRIEFTQVEVMIVHDAAVLISDAVLASLVILEPEAFYVIGVGLTAYNAINCCDGGLLHGFNPFVQIACLSLSAKYSLHLRLFA